MIDRESRCPLCGAKMTPADYLDACAEVADAHLGVLSAHCPHCQGHFDILPANDRIEIGYLVGTSAPRFAGAFFLPCEGLRLENREDPPGLLLRLAERTWYFPE